MRRAMSPAIWRTTTVPRSVCSCQSIRSLRVAQSLIRASRNWPGVWTASITVPWKGTRLTWTSKTERKTETRRIGPRLKGGLGLFLDVGHQAIGGGDQNLGVGGGSRSGSRKK